jgi:hypothetical protein
MPTVASWLTPMAPPTLWTKSEQTWSGKTLEYPNDNWQFKLLMASFSSTGNA